MLKLFRMHYIAKLFDFVHIRAVFLIFYSPGPILALKGVKFTFNALSSEICHLKGSYCTNVEYKLVGLENKAYELLNTAKNIHSGACKSKKGSKYRDFYYKRGKILIISNI